MYYKPKTVVELKIFMAKSTVGIFQAANTVNIKLNYYGFDRFTHVFNNISHITDSILEITGTPKYSFLELYILTHSSNSVSSKSKSC